MTKIRAEFRFEQVDIGRWKVQAGLEGLTLSEWIRRQCNRKARKVPLSTPTEKANVIPPRQKEIPKEVHLGWGPYSEARLQHLLKNSALGDAFREGKYCWDQEREYVQDKIAGELFTALRDGVVTADQLTPAELNAVDEYKQLMPEGSFFLPARN
jgi:hypothetical protein